MLRPSPPLSWTLRSRVGIHRSGQARLRGSTTHFARGRSGSRRRNCPSSPATARGLQTQQSKVCFSVITVLSRHRPCRDRPGCSLQSGRGDPHVSTGIDLSGGAPWSPSLSGCAPEASGWAHPDKPMPVATISAESIIVFMANPSNAGVADRDSHHGRHLLVG